MIQVIEKEIEDFFEKINVLGKSRNALYKMVNWELSRYLDIQVANRYVMQYKLTCEQKKAGEIYCKVEIRDFCYQEQSFERTFQLRNQQEGCHHLLHTMEKTILEINGCGRGVVGLFHKS